ncbi:MAG TPA: hypothetical protein VL793_12330 [Patescibacteria group bacterium]|nr:hypothetical protein [Patescibacteria group bacterium]
MNRAFAGLFLAVAVFSHHSDCLGLGNTARVSGIHTNWVDHWVTNTTDIYMQLNRFVTEYHTNCVTSARTNYIDVFATNVLIKIHTNTLVVQAVKTNWVQTYRTNFVMLNLTNWTTVLAFRTNWVTKPVTNMVEIELPRETAVKTSADGGTSSVFSEPLALQASRTARAPANNQVEVQLSISWRNGARVPVQVQQWRIERDDGSILCFGQETEFRRSLPIGTYKITVRAQRDAKSPLVAALGTLTVTSREVLLEQRPAHSSSI